MSLDTGARFGSYQVVAAIGAGGMGEVYRARDTKLDREVALKILPDSFAADLDRVARFTREAQTLAALNHTNIAQVYGLEEGPSDNGTTTRALVMELVEGEDLSQPIARGAMPIGDVLAIGKQIAEALEAAHEQNIVHRDLKPANIKVRPDGTVKVLDFGLAKAMDVVGAPGSAEPAYMASRSPTLTTPAITQVGVILGTAAYMSPEQARGKTVDKRADIWAFGVVLYEMLSGRSLFEGEDVSITLASVMMKEPEWRELPASTPPSLRRLLTRCLKKDPKARLRDIGEARLQMEEMLVGTTDDALPASATVRVAPWWRRAVPVVAASILTAALAAFVVRMTRPLETAPQVARFSFALGEGQAFTNPGRVRVAISPDGTNMVYVASNRLWRRTLSDPEARPIPGTEMAPEVGIANPIFSPDGQTIAFWTQYAIKSIPLAGGAPQLICQASNVFGMSWTGDRIVFGQRVQGRRGVIMRVLAAGGEPETIVTMKDGELASSPQMLSDDVIMFTFLGAGLGWDKAKVVTASIPFKDMHEAIALGADARYLPSGHLVYAVSGNLLAVPFDVKQLRTIGSPQTVVEGVTRQVQNNTSTGVAQFAVSPGGTLMYVPGPRDAGATTTGGAQLGKVDRAGLATEFKIPPGEYRHVSASPDGTRIAFTRDDGTRKAAIYTYDLSGTTAMQLLTHDGNSRYPVWSADSKRIAFTSDREGAPAIFWQLADGTGPVERLTKPKPDERHVPESWSPTTDTLLFSVTKGSNESSFASVNEPETDHALWMLSLADKTPNPFGNVHSSTPLGAVFSPKGEWVAYTRTQPATTTEPSKTTIYVEPFPPTGEIHEFDPKAGDKPHSVRWSPNGKELFYDPRQGGFEAVSVKYQPFQFGFTVELPHNLQLNASTARTPYDIIPTTGEFVGRISGGGGGRGRGGKATGARQGAAEAAVEDPAPASIQVVLNWFEELKERVGQGSR